MKHIVLMGGGSGISHLLPAFCQEPDWQISAIVATGDSGGSTGEIRKSYPVPAIGDIVKNIAALGGKETLWMTYRYQEGFLAGHTTGNLWLLGLIQSYGFSEGIKKAHQIVGYKEHRIIPATNLPHDIVVTTVDGERILSEETIIKCTQLSGRVKSIELSPSVSASEEAQEALERADLIILGPGTLYTSLIACLLPHGMQESWKKSKAQKFFIANAANFPPGHCDGYTLSTYLEEIWRLTAIKEFDYVLAHDGKNIPREVMIEVSPGKNITILDVLTSDAENPGGKFDAIQRNTLRHDGEKVVQWIKKYFH